MFNAPPPPSFNPLQQMPAIQQTAQDLFGAAPQLWQIRDQISRGINVYPAQTTSQPLRPKKP